MNRLHPFVGGVVVDLLDAEVIMQATKGSRGRETGKNDADKEAS
jgi:hypothetical protein